MNLETTYPHEKIFDETLQEMFDELSHSSELYSPSPFWQELSADGVNLLKSAEFKNFKRTINMRYFNWTVLTILVHQFLPMFGEWLKSPNAGPLHAKFSNYRSKNEKVTSYHFFTAFIYRVYVMMLWQYVKKLDHLNLLARLNEPLVGNPFVIEYNGRLISQDLCNSIHEFYSIWNGAQGLNENVSVVELGAGYGRLAYVFQQILTQSTYTIIDIPPALAVSQEYLTQVFPEKKVFRFRHFDSFEKVRKEFESSQIRFLSANQIELLPEQEVDVFINISSLHEMSYAQIENYLNQIDRLRPGYFYTKQWKKSRAKSNGFVISQYEYPIPSNWTEIYHRHHPIQGMFFEAMYQVK